MPKYRDILVAYLTDPDERLGPVSASVPRGRVSFRMVPPRDKWQLQYYEPAVVPDDPDTGWECVRETTNTQYYFQYALDSAHGRGLVATWNELNNVTHYLRAVVTKDGESACAKARDAYGQTSRPDSDMAVITRTLKLVYGTGIHWNISRDGPRTVPKSFANAPTLRTVDDLIYQSPGGHWTTQMLVSFGAAVVVMIILRSMVGLMLGILLLPVTAYGMVLIGYGSYWYVLVMVLLFVFSVVAWGMAIRRA